MLLLRCRASCLLTVSTLVFLSGVESIGRCNSDGRCNYGGKCDEKGNCRCAFDCMKHFPRERYCRYKQSDGRAGVKHPPFYYNLCQVLSHACNLQAEVPIVKAAGSKRHRIESCMKKKSDYRLCPNVTNYLGGKCGVSEGRRYFTAGICQMRISTNETECKCPSNKQGSNCESRILPMYSNFEAEDKGDMVPATLQLVKPTSHQNPTSPVAATLYTGIAILLILSLFILFTYRKCCHLELTSNDPLPSGDALQLRSIKAMIMANDETKMHMNNIKHENGSGKDTAIKLPPPSSKEATIKSNLCAHIKP